MAFNFDYIVTILRNRNIHNTILIRASRLCHSLLCIILSDDHRGAHVLDRLVSQAAVDSNVQDSVGTEGFSSSCHCVLSKLWDSLLDSVSTICHSDVCLGCSKSGASQRVVISKHHVGHHGVRCYLFDSHCLTAIDTSLLHIVIE